MAKKSVQKRVSDASKKKIAKAKKDRQKAMKAQKTAKAKGKAAAGRESDERWGVIMRAEGTPERKRRRAIYDASRAEEAAAKKTAAKGKKAEISAIRETRAAKSDKVGKAARTGESMKDYSRSKTVAKAGKEMETRRRKKAKKDY